MSSPCITMSVNVAKSTLAASPARTAPTPRKRPWTEEAVRVAVAVVIDFVPLVGSRIRAAEIDIAAEFFLAVGARPDPGVASPTRGATAKIMGGPYAELIRRHQARLFAFVKACTSSEQAAASLFG